eukprot:407692_1
MQRTFYFLIFMNGTLVTIIHYHGPINLYHINHITIMPTYYEHTKSTQKQEFKNHYSSNRRGTRVRGRGRGRGRSRPGARGGYNSYNSGYGGYNGGYGGRGGYNNSYGGGCRDRGGYAGSNPNKKYYKDIRVEGLKRYQKIKRLEELNANLLSEKEKWSSEKANLLLEKEKWSSEKAELLSEIIQKKKK